MKELKQREREGPKLKQAQPGSLKTGGQKGLKVAGKGVERLGGGTLKEAGQGAAGTLKRAGNAAQRAMNAPGPRKGDGQQKQEDGREPGVQIAHKVLEAEDKAIHSTARQAGQTGRQYVRLAKSYLAYQKEKKAKEAAGTRTIAGEMARQKAAQERYRQETGRGLEPVSRLRARKSAMEQGRQKAVQDAQKAALAKQRRAASQQPWEREVAPVWQSPLHVEQEVAPIWKTELRREKSATFQRPGSRRIQEKADQPALKQKIGQAQAGLKEKKEMPGRQTKTKDVTVSLRQKEALRQNVSRRMRLKASQQAAQKAAAKSEKAAQKGAAQTVKLVGKAAGKALRAASTVASTAALLFQLLFVAAIGGIIASPFGIFFAGENDDPGTITPAAAVAQINEEYAEKLEEVENSFSGYSQVRMDGAPPDWREVMAVFAVKVAGNDGPDAADVATFDADRVERLREVFWDMVGEIWGEVVQVVENKLKYTVLIIHIETKTVDEMREFYHFTKYQNSALDALLEEMDVIGGMMGDLTITQEDALELLQNLPENLSPERKAVIQHALTLVGKVNYFWGGKSSAIGWDSRWGTTQKVTAPGSQTTGTYRPYGLDCSGYVDWVFNNALGYVPGHGGGAAAQHTYCTPISWNEAQPGDLVFYPDDSHVGIVGGRDANGNLLIIHCSSGSNNVVISGVKGFTDVGRPDIWSD